MSTPLNLIWVYVLKCRRYRYEEKEDHFAIIYPVKFCHQMMLLIRASCTYTRYKNTRKANTV
ncbi:AAEL017439-PA [Aedes aegypti]|uniref:AAEL017439-PA n=1 Tax=Aedes aegypti TaxID=7159 RepID=J9HJB7_AEDAE|nr:AAEL017439-PA [Aedes aegypti]